MSGADRTFLNPREYSASEHIYTDHGLKSTVENKMRGIKLPMKHEVSVVFRSTLVDAAARSIKPGDLGFLGRSG